MTDQNIFNYLKTVLFKKDKAFNNTPEENLNFSPFMLQRWCSMASTECAHIINETSNRWLFSIREKSFYLKLFLTVLPKMKQKKVAYIKKPAKSNTDTTIKELSNVLELSEREIVSLFKNLKRYD